MISPAVFAIALHVESVFLVFGEKRMRRRL